MQRYNLENMFTLIKSYFLQEYGYAGDNIELNNRYQRTINSEDANMELLGIVAQDLQILQLAEGCYWTVLAFSLAHEMAHAYLSGIGKKCSERHPEKETSF